MNYTDDKGKAGEYLRLTLGLISKHNLAATPINYTVWYEYVAGKNLKLKKALDRSKCKCFGRRLFPGKNLFYRVHRIYKLFMFLFAGIDKG